MTQAEEIAAGVGSRMKGAIKATSAQQAMAAHRDLLSYAASLKDERAKRAVEIAATNALPLILCMSVINCMGQMARECLAEIEKAQAKVTKT